MIRTIADDGEVASRSLAGRGKAVHGRFGHVAFCILINPVAGAVTIAIWAGMALIAAGIGHIAISMLFRKANLKVTSFKDEHGL